MSDTSFSVILRRTLRCIGPAELLVPLPFAVLHTILVGGMPVLGLILGVLVLCCWPAYLLDALRSWARGRDNIGSKLDLASTASGARSLIVLAPAVVLIVLLPTSTTWYLRDLLLAMVLFWLPASLLVLALGDSLIEAVNPVGVLRAIGAMGRDYLRLWVLGSVTMIGAHGLARFVGMMGETYIMLLASTLVTAMLGAVAYGRHERLRQDVDIDALMEVDEPQAAPAQHEFLRRASILEREEGPQAALTWLLDQLQRFHAPPAVHREALRLAVAQDRRDVVVDHGSRMVRRSLAEGDIDEALRSATACVEAVPDFSQGQLEDDDALIALAQDKGRQDLVLKLCLAFIERHGRYRRSVDHAITAAQLLDQRYGRTDDARRLLENAIERGAKDEQLEAVQQQLRELTGGA